MENIETIPDIEPNPDIKIKTIKKKITFEATCNHCSKIFKIKKNYDIHIKEQKCYKPNEITYCKICDITYDTHINYTKHLITMEHINNIGFDKQERLKTKEINKALLIDPYLTNNDINKITKSNLGNGFTFILESGETKNITLEHKPIPEQEHKINNEIKPITPPEVIATDRQQKILEIILKLSKNTNIEACNEKFYKILDEKMHIEDYKGFQMLIKKLNISEEHQKSYLQLIHNYLNHLISLHTKGTINYKDKDISQIVVNLSY